MRQLFLYSENGEGERRSMRIDKYLKNSRIIKRRTVAKEACEQERVSVNGRTAKPGTEVEPGDTVHIEFGNGSVTFKVLAVPNAVRKEDAASMYEIIESA
jgi:ribosomal 50S subunit-recycling heat shock protein